MRKYQTGMLPPRWMHFLAALEKLCAGEADTSFNKVESGISFNMF
jgi:hypothetical protein